MVTNLKKRPDPHPYSCLYLHLIMRDTILFGYGTNQDDDILRLLTLPFNDQDFTLRDGLQD